MSNGAQLQWLLIVQDVQLNLIYDMCRYLDPDYRRPLILLELLGFHADIICLQEMDEKAFAEYFLPQMQQAGRFALVLHSCHSCTLQYSGNNCNACTSHNAGTLNASKSHNASSGRSILPMPALLLRHASSKVSFGNGSWPCCSTSLQTSTLRTGAQNHVAFVSGTLVVSQRLCLK